LFQQKNVRLFILKIKKRGDVPSFRNRSIDIILKQADRLNRLVEDLLTISNIELNEIILNFESISLNTTITNVISLVEAKANLKKIVNGFNSLGKS